MRNRGAHWPVSVSCSHRHPSKPRANTYRAWRACSTFQASTAGSLRRKVSSKLTRQKLSSNEHRPIHVKYGAGEAVFMEPVIELSESHGLKVRELSKAQSLAERHQELIIQKWHEHLD